jgi:hypothetical protein
MIHSKPETASQTSLLEKGAATYGLQESQTHDLGVILPGSPLLGINTRCIGGKTYALAFSEKELLVRHPRFAH